MDGLFQVPSDDSWAELRYSLTQVLQKHNFWDSYLNWVGTCNENGFAPITRIKHNTTQYVKSRATEAKRHTQTPRYRLFMIFYISRAPDTTKKLVYTFLAEEKNKVKQSTEKILQQRTVTMDTGDRSSIYFQYRFNSSFLHYSASLKTAFTKTYLPAKSAIQALPLRFNTPWWTWPFIPFPTHSAAGFSFHITKQRY